MKRVHYNRGDEIVEVVIRDSSGARIEVRRCNLSDDKECGHIIKWLKDKYNFKIKVDKEFLDTQNEFFRF